MSNIKLPLIFNLNEDDNCCAWKNNVEVWQTFTKEDDGVEEIIRILDETFQSHEATEAYYAFKDYVEYRWSSDQNFSSFVVEYEKR